MTTPTNTPENNSTDQSSHTIDFPTWITVTIPAHLAGESFFGSGLFKWTDEAEEMMDRVRGSNAEVTLDLVRVSPVQLGLGRGNSSRETICEQAEKLGLKTCPRELALYLFWKKLVGTEICHIGMYPIRHKLGGGCSAIFCADGFHNILDHACCCEGQVFCNVYSTWVFVKPRKQETAV